MTSSYWFQEAQGEAPDLGYEIPHSLRFTGGLQTLSRSQGAFSTYTVSYWIKKSDFGTAQTWINSATSGQDIGWNADGAWTWDQTNTNGSTAELFRDPAAWNHIVFNYTPDVLNLYINGKKVSPRMSNGANSWGGTMTIGGTGCQGYLAEFMMIDGQQLEPTAFGRYNRNGQWVPIEPDFAQNGVPASGMLYSATPASEGVWEPPFDTVSYSFTRPPSNAFNGQLSGPGDADAPENSAAAGDGSKGSTYVIWRPQGQVAEQVKGITKLEVHTWESARIYVNETLMTETNDRNWRWVDLTSNVTFPLDLTNLAIMGGTGSQGTLSAIRINGDTIITDAYLWSSMITNTGFGSGSDGSYFFQDNTLSSTYSAPGPAVFTPTTTIQVKEKVSLWVESSNVAFGVNGGDLTTAVQGQYTDIAFTGDLTQVSIEWGTGEASLTRLAIDGNQLIDGQNSSFGNEGFRLRFEDPNDLGKDYSGNGNNFGALGFQNIETDNAYSWTTDTPSHNYCVLNENDCYFSGAVERASLGVQAAGGSGLVTIPGTIAAKGGKYYWEVLMSNVGDTANTATGITFNDGIAIQRSSSGAVGSVTGEVGYHPNGGINVEGTTTINAESYSSGDTISVLMNCDDEQVTFWKNGVDQGTVDFYNSEAGWKPLLGYVNGYSSSNAANFGQIPFKYEMPDGYDHLQSANLPNKKVIGTDHFRAITAPGSFILSAAQGQVNGDNGTGFQKGLYWIKDRDNTQRHQFVDSVTANVNNWEADTQSEGAYVEPSGVSVAWCWKADESWTDTGVGPCLRNKEAGFSIIQAELNGPEVALTTVPHGLDQAPEFMIWSADPSNTAWIRTYHAPGNRPGQCVFLNRNVLSSVNATLVVPTPGDDTTIDLGVLSGATSGDFLSTVYAWHSVPGYSKFGTYFGSISSDQDNSPFIHCGFKPAFVMFKNLGMSGQNWIIADSSRSTGNVAGNTLQANEAQAENNTAAIDILSNGFKIRNAGSDNNQSEVLYCAWAEHPFAGKNVAPTTGALIGPPVIDGTLPGIADSLRFRDGTSLSALTAPNSTQSDISTTSFWMKVSETELASLSGVGMDLVRFGGTQYAGYLDFSLGGGSYTNQLSLVTYDQSGGGVRGYTATDGQFRDPSAWYHVVMVRDGVNESEPDMVKFYINGVRQEVSFSGINMGVGLYNNNGYSMSIGGAYGNHFRGYLADLHHVDGQALSPTVFGEYSDTGVWVPKETDISDYGTHGCHLVFDPAYIYFNSSGSKTILRDQSSSGNDFEMTGFELGDYYNNDLDWMKDGPGNNYSTINPLSIDEPGRVDIENGNLAVSSTSDGSWFVSDTQLGHKRYYFEMTLTADATAGNNSGTNVGITRNFLNSGPDRVRWSTTDVLSVFGTETSNWAGTTWGSAGDVLGVEYDQEYTTVSFYLNGALMGTVTDAGLGNGDFVPLIQNASSSGSSYYAFNFGQLPFKYPAPNRRGLNSQNLPESTITNGRDYFGAVTYTGDSGNSRSITDLDFQPDLLWIKRRDASESHALYDSVRGVQERIQSDTNGAESTQTSAVSSFNADGWTMGSDTQINFLNAEYVAWAWKAGGPAVVNNDGNIESQVSVNNTAGFSIVTYTGTGSIATVGHGLDNAPDFIIFKNRDSAENWACYHRSNGATGILALNTPDDFHTNSGYFTNSDPDANDIALGNSPMTNGSGNRMVAYCWNTVPGYSAFGRYSGSGTPQGPMVYLGFKPAWLMIKCRDSSDTNATNWFIHDTSRSLHNPANNPLEANKNAAEGDFGSSLVDILSNGFKLRGGSNQFNGNQDYVYIAFAENPFNISNAR